MSLSYTQLLIPRSPEYRPESDAVAAFAKGMISHGNVANPLTISFSRIIKNEQAFREVRNMTTGETIKMRLPSRKAELPETLTDAQQVVGNASGQREYDVVLVSEGIPTVPPCRVGYVENGTWSPMTEEYYLQIRCRVRGHVVRLSVINGAEELDRPFDLAKWQPTFDEDCSAEEIDGLFCHPEMDCIQIAHAGCASFWVEFKYGKFIFPRLRNDRDLNLLDESIVALARKTFGSDFVQACLWD